MNIDPLEVIIVLVLVLVLDSFLFVLQCAFSDYENEDEYDDEILSSIA